MEIWKQISGADSHYEISNMGRVRNSKTNKILKLKYTKLRKGKYTTVRCNLRLNKKQITKYVSRMVLEAFAPIKNSDIYHADHVDHDPTNNKLSNLRWLTPEENNKHRRTVEYYEDQLRIKDEIIKELTSRLKALNIFNNV